MAAFFAPLIATQATGTPLGIEGISTAAMTYVIATELVSLLENLSLLGLNVPLLRTILDVASGGKNDVLLHALPLQSSVQVATVNAFGLTDPQIHLVEATIHPIHMIHMQDHIQIIVPEREYEDTVRAVHRILLEAGSEDG